jgi:hypothetical protein
LLHARTARTSSPSSATMQTLQMKDFGVLGGMRGKPHAGLASWHRLHCRKLAAPSLHACSHRTQPHRAFKARGTTWYVSASRAGVRYVTCPALRENTANLTTHHLAQGDVSLELRIMLRDGAAGAAAVIVRHKLRIGHTLPAPHKGSHSYLA